MDELLKLLDNSIDAVKAGLVGKSGEELSALRAAEDAGKTRKGVLDAIDTAIAALDLPAADGDGPAPAGAPDEDDVSKRIDMNDPVLTGAQLADRQAATD